MSDTIDLSEHDLEAKRRLVESVRLDLELRALEASRKVMESASSQTLVDPLDARRDEDGRLWHLIGRAQDRYSNELSSVAESLADLDLMRRESRVLCRSNPFARRALSVMVAYTALGWTYQVKRKPGVSKAMVPDDLVKVGQRGLEEFRRVARLDQREKEVVRRCHRDGEAITQFFARANDHLQLRWIEPGQLVPPSSNEPQDSWGIRCDPEDVETVLGYWVRRDPRQEPEFVEASQVQHVKLNVDSNVKRGEPSFFACAEDLRLAHRVKKNGATITSIWAAIAYVRKHTGKTATQVRAFLDDRAEGTRMNRHSGNVERLAIEDRPRVLDAPDSTEYQFPTAGLRLDHVETMVQVLLRSVASSFDLPEWLLTAKNDSVNFASALVSEGPTGVAFRSWHSFFYEPFVEVNARGFAHAVRQGLVPGFSPALLELVEIVGVPPQTAVRDRAQEVQADSILRRDGVLSPQTYAARHGLEYQDELENLQAHIEAMGGVDPVLGGLVPGDAGVSIPPTMTP